MSIKVVIRVAALAAFCETAGAARAAWAQVDPCDAPIHAGVELRRQHRDADALATFRGATGVCQAARLLVQIAWAEQAMGAWVSAERDLRAALQGTADPWVEARRARLQQDLASIGQHLGQVMVTGGVPGAEVFLDGERVGALPITQPIQAVVGSFRLELRHPGYYTATRQIVVTAGQVTQELIPMRAEPAAAPVVVAPVAIPPVVSAPVVTAPDATAPVATTRPVEPGSPRADSSRTAWTVGLAIGAGVALATGVVALVVREGQVSSFNDNPLCFEHQGVAYGGADCASAQSTAGTMQGLAIGALVTGGALAVASGVLWLTAPRRNTEHAGASFACGSGPGTFGLACGARF